MISSKSAIEEPPLDRVYEKPYTIRDEKLQVSKFEDGRS